VLSGWQRSLPKLKRKPVHTGSFPSSSLAFTQSAMALGCCWC
jgi:hypothetical protein